VIANKESGEHADHRDGRADGQVDAAHRDDERSAEGERGEDGRLLENIGCVPKRKKLQLGGENTMIRMASAISGRASASIAGGYR
jgi:hypothetical protein